MPPRFGYLRRKDLRIGSSLRQATIGFWPTSHPPESNKVTLQESRHANRSKSELKVERFTREGDHPILLDCKKHHHHDLEADAETAVTIAERNGYHVVGKPIRKPNTLKFWA